MEAKVKNSTETLGAYRKKANESEFSTDYGQSDLFFEEETPKEKIGEFSVPLCATTPAQLAFLQRISNIPVDGPVPFELSAEASNYLCFLGDPLARNTTYQLSWDAFNVAYAKYCQNPVAWKDVTVCLGMSGVINKIISTYNTKIADKEFGKKILREDWIMHCADQMNRLFPKYNKESSNFPYFWESQMSMVLDRFYICERGETYAYDMKKGYRGTVSVEDQRYDEETTEDAWNRIPGTHTHAADVDYSNAIRENLNSTFTNFLFLHKDKENLMAAANVYVKFVRPLMEVSDIALETVGELLQSGVEKSRKAESEAEIMEEEKWVD